MAEVVCISAFDHAGIRYRVGEIVDEAHVAFVLFPTKFTRRYDGEETAVGTAPGTLGTLIGKRAIYNTGGTIIGYSPVYDAITG